MWNAILNLDPSVTEKIVRPLIIYTFLVIALRLSGKREIGQNNALELVVLLAVANAVQNGIIGQDTSITGALIGATTLFVVNGVLEYAVSRNHRVHQIVIGRSVSLIKGGVVNERALRRQRLSVDDLLTEAVEHGAASLRDVETAVLGANGHILITLRSDSRLHQQIELLTEQIRSLSDSLNVREQRK